MNAQSLWVLFVALSSRFLPYLRLRSGVARLALCLAYDAALVWPLVHRANAPWYLAVVAAVSLVDWLLLRRARPLDGDRALATLLVVAATIAPLNASFVDVGLPRLASSAAAWLGAAWPGWPWLSAGALRRGLLVAVGLELCAVEANYLVVSALKRFFAFPKGSGRDERPGMGQLIGALKRAILYVLIVSGNFASIGFVIAAKALARFKKLEDKDFAEYFLVGTMASVCVTLVLGLLVRLALV